MENIIYVIFIDEFLKFEDMEYLNHHVKFEMWPVLSKFRILFSAVKLKLGKTFPNSYTDSKFGLLTLGLRLYFQVFDNSQTD